MEAIAFNKLNGYFEKYCLMKRSLNILLFISILTIVSCQKVDFEAQLTIDFSGKVTNSENNKPIQGVVISDGYNTGITDENGLYKFKGHPDARHMFYSVPEMYKIPLKGGAPCFHKKINTSFGRVETNFKLTLLENGVEDEFTLFCVADPQINSASNLNRLNNETIVDIKKELEKHNPVYGITLGDLVFDKSELMGDLKQSFVSTRIPFFHTIGNHDFLEGISDPLRSIESYESHFGPIDYSFNRGNVHIVIMNNVLYKGNRRYGTGFTKEQINWLKSDLQHVPKNKMLIVCLHIPIVDNNKIEYRNEFLDIIKSFKEVHIMSGHYHRNKNYWHNDYNIYEHVTGTASGLWWAGTINKCGAPNGYYVYEVEGNRMKNWYYKSVNYPADFQIKMYEPYSFGDRDGFVVANVWNADKDWTIELLENEVSKGEMQQFTDYDPGAYALLKASGQIEPDNKNSSKRYTKTDHLFRLRPTDKNARISIKATDKFRNIYNQNKFEINMNEYKKYKQEYNDIF